MKTLTTYKLMQILLKEDMQLMYEACKINLLEEALINKHINCMLDAYCFDEMECEYPELVSLSKTEIHISNPQQFMQKLDMRLRYVNDEDLEKMVIETWATL